MAHLSDIVLKNAADSEALHRDGFEFLKWGAHTHGTCLDCGERVSVWEYRKTHYGCYEYRSLRDNCFCTISE
jgi:hypothetical protein